MKTKLTKQQRKDLALKEYLKKCEEINNELTKQQRKDLACEEYLKKCEEINNEEPEEIIEHKGHKYKLVEE